MGQTQRYNGGADLAAGHSVFLAKLADRRNPQFPRLEQHRACACFDVQMPKPTVTLATLLLLAAALPIWIYVACIVAWGHVFRSPIPAIGVLCGITLAVQRIFRGRPSSWAIAALLAGVITLAALSIARWWVISS
jgi:hypothetical protein